jgi:hypothetical protein
MSKYYVVENYLLARNAIMLLAFVFCCFKNNIVVLMGQVAIKNQSKECELLI